jgi:hypothetical protein
MWMQSIEARGTIIANSFLYDAVASTVFTVVFGVNLLAPLKCLLVHKRRRTLREIFARNEVRVCGDEGTKTE